MLNHLGYLWGVAAVVWLGTMVYTISILRGQHRLKRELAILERRIDELSSTLDG